MNTDCGCWIEMPPLTVNAGLLADLIGGSINRIC